MEVYSWICGCQWNAPLGPLLGFLQAPCSAAEILAWNLPFFSIVRCVQWVEHCHWMTLHPVWLKPDWLEIPSKQLVVMLLLGASPLPFTLMNRRPPLKMICLVAPKVSLGHDLWCQLLVMAKVCWCSADASAAGSAQCGRIVIMPWICQDNDLHIAQAQAVTIVKIAYIKPINTLAYGMLLTKL